MCPPGTPWQGLWHLSTLQEHLQRAGWQRLPGPGGEQPQTRCGGLPRAVSSPQLFLHLARPSHVQVCPCCFPGTMWHSERTGDVSMPEDFPSCGAADRPAGRLVLKGAPAPMAAQSVEQVSLIELHCCRCSYTLQERKTPVLGRCFPGSVAAPPKCSGVTLAPALHHPVKDTSKKSSDISFF